MVCIETSELLKFALIIKMDLFISLVDVTMDVTMDVTIMLSDL